MRRLQAGFRRGRRVGHSPQQRARFGRQLVVAGQHDIFQNLLPLLTGSRGQQLQRFHSQIRVTAFNGRGRLVVDANRGELLERRHAHGLQIVAEGLNQNGPTRRPDVLVRLRDRDKPPDSCLANCDDSRPERWTRAAVMITALLTNQTDVGAKRQVQQLVRSALQLG